MKKEAQVTVKVNVRNDCTRKAMTNVPMSNRTAPTRKLEAKITAKSSEFK